MCVLSHEKVTATTTGAGRPSSALMTLCKPSHTLQSLPLLYPYHSHLTTLSSSLSFPPTSALVCVRSSPQALTSLRQVLVARAHASSHLSPLRAPSLTPTSAPLPAYSQDTHRGTLRTSWIWTDQEASRIGRNRRSMRGSRRCTIWPPFA